MENWKKNKGSNELINKQLCRITNWMEKIGFQDHRKNGTHDFQQEKTERLPGQRHMDAGQKDKKNDTYTLLGNDCGGKT